MQLQVAAVPGLIIRRIKKVKEQDICASNTAAPQMQRNMHDGSQVDPRCVDARLCNSAKSS